MESYLLQNFEVNPKHSSEQLLMKWRNNCQFVKNPKRRFRYVANLSKRHQAAAMQRAFREKLKIAVLLLKALSATLKGVPPSPRRYTVPAKVKAAGFVICPNELGSVVKAYTANKLEFHGGVNGIAEKLSTSITHGLLTDDNQLNRRKEIYGINKLDEIQAPSFWTFVWEAFQDMTLIVDSLCALVSLIIGIKMEGWQERAHDALVIVASILLIVLVTAANDFWQSSQFRNWEKEKNKYTVHVTRDGFRQKLLSDDLLPGDIVHLAAGDLVPADGLFVSGFFVLVDQSSLTKESKLQRTVNTESPPLFFGSKVLDGSCKMMVTSVGMRTQWGKLFAVCRECGNDETPLQVKLNGVTAIIGRVGLHFAMLTFAVLVQGLLTRKLQETTHWCWSAYDALEIFKHFTIAFTIFSIAVPEGLSLGVTLNLAFAMKQMVNEKALIWHLAACESMGSATTICTKITGTLTTNHKSVIKSCICMEINKHSNFSSLCSEIPSYALRLLLQSIFNNTGGEVFINKHGEVEILGTPIETALLKFGLSLGGDFQAEKEVTKLVNVEPFNSTDKQIRTVIELPEGGVRIHYTGASEIVLAACDKMINSNGEIVPLDDVSIKHLKTAINQFADEGLITLCIAYTELEPGFSATNPIPNSGYTCIAILGINDSIHPGVKGAVSICRSAGIAVHIVTDDNINTAKAIARECGILTDDGIAIEGPEIQGKTQEELLQLIPKIQVMAQSSPKDKHTLVKQLKTTFNQIVAVTGDGANDASSLHEADIGLAMGISGTQVAKESADIIILDDNFSTIVTAIKWGRSVTMNVKKFVQFELTVTMVTSILNISSACLTGSVPFSDIELLWLSLFMDTLVAFAFASEPANDYLMKTPPVEGSLITNAMWRNIFGQCLYQVIIIWYLRAEGKAILHLVGPDSNKILETFVFNSFVFCQVSSLISSRKMEEINVFEGLLNNHIFVAVVCCIILLQIIIIHFLGTIANTSPLCFSQWFLSVFIGLLGMPVAAGVKMVPMC